MFKELTNNTQTQEKITYLLLFLFPIAGPVMKHWNSLFYMLLLFVALYDLFKNRNRIPLVKEEKIFLTAAGLFFISFLISANLYGWGRFQTLELGNEIRFLLLVPMYLLVRKYRYSLKVFFAGLVVAIPVIFAFSFVEYFFIPIDVPGVIMGAYSTLFIGPMMALTLLFLPVGYKWWFDNKNFNWPFYLLLAMGLFVAVFSYARTGYITLIAGAVLYSIYYRKNYKQILVYVFLASLLGVVAMSNDKINTRVMSAVSNVENYFKDYQHHTETKVYDLGSLGLRLEMWRASQYPIKEHPIFGIGPRNFPAFIEKYIQQGKVNERMRMGSQLHNSFVEVTTSKGVVGLVLLLILFYYPLLVAWRNRETCEPCYFYALILATALSAISMGESMLINKNNAVAYFIFFSIVTFSYTIRNKYPAWFQQEPRA